MRVRGPGLPGPHGHAGKRPGGPGPRFRRPGREPGPRRPAAFPAPGQGGAGPVYPGGPVCPPGDGPGGREPGPGLRRAHGELSPGGAHRRVRGADRGGGRGAVPVLRRDARGRFKGLKIKKRGTLALPPRSPGTGQIFFR